MYILYKLGIFLLIKKTNYAYFMLISITTTKFYSQIFWGHVWILNRLVKVSHILVIIIEVL